MTIKVAILITDTVGNPTGADLTTLTGQVNKVETDNPGVVVHTLDKNRAAIHPRPTKPTYVL